MIVARTPLRIPLAGGLTDIKEYADIYGGITISCTIDKYIYVIINNSDNYKIYYDDICENVSNVNEILHNHIREAIKMCNMEKIPLKINIINDMPYNSGLGSSGALTVAILSALHAFNKDFVKNEKIINEASQIEIEILKGSSGYHDHTITQLGGLRFISYNNKKYNILQPKIEDEIIYNLKKRFMLFYFGNHNKTKPALSLLANNLNEVLPKMHKIKQNAFALIDALENKNIDKVGFYIQEHQNIKQKLSNYFENDFVISIMDRVKKIGAYAQIPGGKIGSYLIIFKPLNISKDFIIKYFNDLKYIPFSFTSEGTKIINI